MLNKAGYYWRSLPRIQGLSKEQLGKRLVFVNAHIDFPPARWLAHFNMVMDGVPLTMAPETLSGREKHAAQRLTCNWTCEGERLNNDIPSACVRVHGVSSLPSIQEGQKHQRHGYLRLELFAPTPVAAVAQELHTLAKKSGCGFCLRARVRTCVQGMSLLPSMQNGHQHQHLDYLRLELFFAATLGGAGAGTPHVG